MKSSDHSKSDGIQKQNCDDIQKQNHDDVQKQNHDDVQKQNRDDIQKQNRKMGIVLHMVSLQMGQLILTLAIESYCHLMSGIHSQNS